jgi:hypothetical protein
MYLESCKALGQMLSDVLGDEFSIEYPNENNFQFSDFVPDEIELLVTLSSAGSVSSIIVSAYEVAELHNNNLTDYVNELASYYKDCVMYNLK